ncbi:MAG: TIGR00725 family protein [Alphaproteobacteria bacterium]
MSGSDPSLMLLPGGKGATLWRRNGPGGGTGGQSARFDPRARVWVPGEAAGKGGRVLSLEEAVTWLQRESGARLRPPIGVIGSREAGPADLALAEEIGRDLARLGLVLLCGGKGGVMERACRGTEAEGGVAVGLLPDDHWSGANPHVTVPLASGIGVARNAIIARAAFVILVVAGGYGTLSEMAFGLQFGRPVITLPSAPRVPGATDCPDWATARAELCRRVLTL